MSTKKYVDDVKRGRCAIHLGLFGEEYKVILRATLKRHGKIENIFQTPHVINS